jgi:hypothetical protein
METRRIAAWMVVLVAVLALVAGAAQAKKKRAPKAPKVSLTCKTDDDCALTKMADGQCCPMLCQPRAVSKASAEALEKYASVCEKPSKMAQCPVPDCAPPRQIVAGAACVSGQCVTRAASPASRD